MDAVKYLYNTAPQKLVYMSLGMTWEITQLPLWSIYYLPPTLRQHPTWTYLQALKVHLFKAFLHHLTKNEILFPTHLFPAAEGTRFRVLNPAPPETYQGPLSHSTIKPVRIGGTWYPTPYPPLNPSKSTEKVVLQIHGGAFILGSGREQDAGASCRSLLTNGGFDRLFAVQYRLAGVPGSGEAFPAALQDVVTAYRYLVQQLRIPARNVVVSGDSAGGNLAVGLLRYLAEYGEKVNLSEPGAALLWSPWVDVAVNVDVRYFEKTPQYGVDYLNGRFGNWGMRSYAGEMDPRDRYITPRGSPFKSGVPIYLHCGGSEVLFHEDVAFAKEMQEAGNKVELWVEEGAVHDILAVGHQLGFDDGTTASVKRAGEWYRGLS